ncbi:imidazole glycerol phosphate synthase subunit hisH [Mycobacteroides abscessus MAB_091912_2446]|uniref:Imidazole glycerol phosphate synthase subunit HisH n=1 Tax=Mycobacteroides abscessus MAB_091912_2446 TaxID=1335414 RepID=A0A829M6G5_9MYCO|nr:imidazole glycerol phosphate synthase subunit hisH [Mycobacteroides abscessus MAB_091912_2446]
MTGAGPKVVVLDYGSGNLRSAQRALERVGADVTVTADSSTALNADGLVVPGVGAFAACMEGLRGIDGERIIDIRLSGGARCWASVWECRSCSVTASNSVSIRKGVGSGPVWSAALMRP